MHGGKSQASRAQHRGRRVQREPPEDHRRVDAHQRRERQQEPRGRAALPPQQAEAAEDGRELELPQIAAAHPAVLGRVVRAPVEQGDAQRPPAEGPAHRAPGEQQQQRVEETQRQDPRVAGRSRAGERPAEEAPRGRGVVAVVGLHAVPASSRQALAEPAHVAPEALPALGREVPLAEVGLLEHRRRRLDGVGLEVSQVATLHVGAPPGLGVGQGGAPVEARVAQLAEVLRADVVVIGLRGVPEHRVVELEEVPPAGGGDEAQHGQPRVLDAARARATPEQQAGQQPAGAQRRHAGLHAVDLHRAEPRRSRLRPGRGGCDQDRGGDEKRAHMARDPTPPGPPGRRLAGGEGVC
jgi:hypothetical protein